MIFNNISNLKLGNLDVQTVYLNNQLVWSPKSSSYTPDSTDFVPRKEISTPILHNPTNEIQQDK